MSATSHPLNTTTGAWWTIQALAKKPPNHAEILIYGDIGESWNSETTSAQTLQHALGAISADEITVRINSYGGSCTDGIAIFNALRRHPAKIAVEIDGIAASVASLIAMAGDTVRMASNGLFMIHAPWVGASGNAQKLRDQADTLDAFAKAMATCYSVRSRIDVDQVTRMLMDGQDHFFTADEALAAGFIDTITDAQAVSAALLAHALSRHSPPAERFPTPSTQEFPMSTDNAAAGDNTKPVATTPHAALNEADIRARTLAAEQTRRQDIRAAFQPFTARDGVQAVLDAHLDDGNKTVEQARAALLEHLGRHVEPVVPAGYSPRIESGETEHEKFIVGAAQAIRARAGTEKRDPANQYNGYRLSELARAYLEKSGVRTNGMDQTAIAAKALSRFPVMAAGQTTSDFSVMLENTLHKQLLNAYTITPDVWSVCCKVGSVSDFRDWNRITPGTIGNIDPVGEAGEYRQKALPDGAKERISVSRYGNIIAVTPEVLINDDISFFADVPALFGRAAKRTIEHAFFSLLTSNGGQGPVMNEDGLNLFHASHGNYVTAGGIPSVATLDAGRQAMALQRDLSRNEILDVKPSIWLGPVSLGSAIRVVNNSTYDPDASNKLQRVNPVANLVSTVVDTGQLSGTGWYLLADPTVMPTFEVVFLNGMSEPQMAQEEDFSTAGLRWRVELPFGIGCIGWRGAYYNDGAT